MGLRISVRQRIRIGRGIFDSSDPNAATIRVLNDTSSPITLVLYTPGQVFTLESKEIGAGTAGDIIVLKAIYDVEVAYANEKKVIRNVQASENISTTASAILSGDYEDDVPISKKVKLIGKTSLVKDYLSGESLEAAVQAFGVAPDDLLEDALEKNSAVEA
ncbi:hypothetical protein K443DRAFT_124640 [Laccaria amethystina LaAM-08-1]|uniref:Uncharacterized protein n=1 Tax=Laccaria amethystina LaAM-08-1 TaxID=1095629 RepID=A0A0C9X3Z7_9AGAR|nr:hypothetical protein K443DRAFT_124640 [Laccaria amethystina LaAM-08-1]